MYKKELSLPQRLISYGIIYLTAIYPLYPAWGTVITPLDNNIHIIEQGNIPIINISTPNSKGVSHN